MVSDEIRRIMIGNTTRSSGKSLLKSLRGVIGKVICNEGQDISMEILNKIWSEIKQSDGILKIVYDISLKIMEF